MDILETIIQHKVEDLTSRPRRSFKKALLEGSGVIAEFKRKSPSKGWIHQNADPVAVAVKYEQGGASCMSVLTDEEFFGGSLDDLRAVRAAVGLPIIRKDFIISEIQIAEAASYGADAVLLIAACLTVSRCSELAAFAHRLGLETLLEIHSEAELGHVGPNIDMVGVNNRNLGTFVTSVENSFRLAACLPEGKVLVSESGISNPETVRKLKDVGFRGFLIGENFMKDNDPGEALASFVKEIC